MKSNQLRIAALYTLESRFKMRSVSQLFQRLSLKTTEELEQMNAIEKLNVIISKQTQPQPIPVRIDKETLIKKGVIRY